LIENGVEFNDFVSDVWGFMIRFMQRLTTLRHLQDIRIIIPE